ncbi:hypothetical protein HIM_05230 [Hirsutella minnesotensis 3608]|uniref:Gfo/Idh/MocA-like oxidoreductase N-terminal domain-containing protein n=1 Tax=Hirsutella minnesotensis 3608 TaxID=1043627 RepID=A0A0F8A5G8_9HYPO|nr:hypothetical protein HIM_05230 [Hirsutella minnesotensis 3608]
MAPIRIALIGLSASAATSWASDAHLPYLLSARGREKYEIVALCNSSVEAAKRAIETYKLPATTRAYGNPADLAADPDVELVVCSTRVDTHHETILPSVRAGKMAYVEWPLAHDVAHAEELAKAARASGSRTLVGLQGQVSPVVIALRQLVDAGRIGKVLSSEVRTSGGTLDRQSISSKLEYWTKRRIGGNMLTIGFGHLFDQVQHVLGEIVDVHGHLHLQRPEVPLRQHDGAEIIGKTQSDVPDLLIVTGSAASSGARVLLRTRRGQSFPGEPKLVWTISGEKGEVRVSSEQGTSLALADPVTIELHDFATDKVETVDWAWEPWQRELPVPARAVAALYEQFAQGGVKSQNQRVPSFEDAVRRHIQLNELLEAWSTQQKV